MTEHTAYKPTSLRQVVAEGMHVWTDIAIDSDTRRVIQKMPPWHEVLEAADVLIEHLRKNGYVIRADDEQPVRP
jgi:hypothetical protein